MNSFCCIAGVSLYLFLGLIWTLFQRKKDGYEWPLPLYLITIIFWPLVALCEIKI